MFCLARPQILGVKECGSCVIIAMGMRIHPSVEEVAVSTPETSASPLPVIQQALDEIVTEMGFTKLKPKQLEAIVAVVSGNDTFVSLPMGYGKSVVVSLLAHRVIDQWSATSNSRTPLQRKWEGRGKV